MRFTATKEIDADALERAASIMNIPLALDILMTAINDAMMEVTDQILDAHMKPDGSKPSLSVTFTAEAVK